MSHDPEEGVRVSAPAATLFGLSALLLSISMLGVQERREVRGDGKTRGPGETWSTGKT